MAAAGTRQAAGETVIEAFAAALGIYQDEAVSRIFTLGLFAPRDLFVHPRALSAGQRRRLELAIAVSREADLLLLDEPTNHLSPDLVEQLEDAVADYPGAVVTVTHDRRWREKQGVHRGSGSLKSNRDGCASTDEPLAPAWRPPFVKCLVVPWFTPRLQL